MIVAILVYWLVARGWQLRFTLPEMGHGQLDLSFFRLSGGLESKFLHGPWPFFSLLWHSVSIWAGSRWYGISTDSWSGVDYADDHFTLPLYWLVIVALIVGAGLVVLRRWIAAAVAVGGSFALMFLVPAIAGALYVKPNEISLERPYIQTHIEATRAAYGLADRMREIEMHTDPTAVIDTSKHKPLLDNVRLWDWRPFHDTVTQMQALRPYYVFHDTDVDRYTIDGQYRQILLSPRELDITQLPGDQASWINPHFIYTHGYGLVLAEVSKITPDGQPVYLVQDMPPLVKTPSLKIERPELYYGEMQQDPVFVDTAQEEFDYPRGSDNAKTHYAGKGGFPISSLLMRLAATVDFGDSNIVLTGYLTDNSRMMIHRRIRERLQTLAPYLTWDNDPYLVITPAGPARLDVGRLHHLGRTSLLAFDRRLWWINYIRNSVKATIDAYDGETHLYVFDAADPVIAAYRALFPSLYEDAVAHAPGPPRAYALRGRAIPRAIQSLQRLSHAESPGVL